jgi:tetratricopeptide (TPR) repeat protein
MSLAQLYLYNQIPYRAAEVIEQGMARGIIKSDARAYQLLADSLLHARERERALAPLRRAGELSDNGNAYLRLAQVYMEREDWSHASEALGAGIEKGNLSSPGHAYLLLGIASANQKRWAAAEHAFAQASAFDTTQGVAAHWLQHLASLRGESSADEVATGASRPPQPRHDADRPAS